MYVSCNLNLKKLEVALVTTPGLSNKLILMIVNVILDQGKPYEEM